MTATPLMQQYRDIKSRHQDAILFFRMGEFYEMFYDDAETASRTLGLTLTSRNNGGAADVPLAGVPVTRVPEKREWKMENGESVIVTTSRGDKRAKKGSTSSSRSVAIRNSPVEISAAATPILHSPFAILALGATAHT